jgi:hypothetical protein
MVILSLRIVKKIGCVAFLSEGSYHYPILAEGQPRRSFLKGAVTTAIYLHGEVVA